MAFSSVYTRRAAALCVSGCRNWCGDFDSAALSAKNQALSVRETIAADCKSKGMNGLSFTDGGL